MRKVFIELIILIAAGVLLWIIFSKTVSIPEKPALISVEKEIEIGKRIKEDLLQLNGFTTISNRKIDSIFKNLSDTLELYLPDNQFKYNFIIVDSDIINAFAIPGGYIAITKGLINYCNTNDELLAVIGHEIGHIENRHVINRLIRDLGISLLLSNDKYVGSEVAKMLFTQSFNRKQEELADSYSCTFLERLGLEPRTLASFLRRLMEQDENISDNFEIVSSHPSMTKRIRLILNYKESKINSSKHFNFKILEIIKLELNNE